MSNKIKGYYSINNDRNMIEFMCNQNLKASEKLGFVTGVTNIIVSDDYNGIIKDLIFNYYLVKYFTDINIDDISEDIDKIEKFLNESDIVNEIKALVGSKLIDELHKEVDRSIEFKTGIKANDIADSLVSILNVIEEKVKLIDTDELVKFAKTINKINGDVTPEKIFEVYSNSDLFKENLKQQNDKRVAHIAKLEAINKTAKNKK